MLLLIKASSWDRSNNLPFPTPLRLRILHNSLFLKYLWELHTCFDHIHPPVPSSSQILLTRHSPNQVCIFLTRFVHYVGRRSLPSSPLTPHPVLDSEIQSWVCISSDFCVPNACDLVEHHSHFVSGFELDIEPMSQYGWKHERIKQVQAEGELSLVATVLNSSRFWGIPECFYAHVDWWSPR